MSLAPILAGVLLTIGAYALSRLVNRRRPSPFTTPVFFSTTLIVLILLAGGRSYDDYRPAADLLVTFLGPATVALAVPIHRNRTILVAHAIPALAGVAVGTVATIVVALTLARLAGLAHEIVLAMSVKSITAPVALELIRLMQGDPTLAAAFVIATGMTGAMLGQWLMDRVRITHPLARGLALGTVAHGQGTAQAATEGELQGAIAGIAMGIAAILTSLIVPAIVGALL